MIGGVLGVKWVGNQYYVGDNNGSVTVFRGVDGSVLGIDLSSAQEGSCWSPTPGCEPLHTTDLVPAARNQVISGIPANDLQSAREILLRLDSQKLPLCSTFPTTLPAPVTDPPATGATATDPTVADPTPTDPVTDPIAVESAGTGDLPTLTDDTSAESPIAQTSDAGGTTPALSATTLSAQTAQPDINCRIG